MEAVLTAIHLRDTETHQRMNRERQKVQAKVVVLTTRVSFNAGIADLSARSHCNATAVVLTTVGQPGRESSQKMKRAELKITTKTSRSRRRRYHLS